MAKKQKLSYQDTEAMLKVFQEREVPATEVGYEILKAFGKSEADVRRYREGKGVLSRYDGLLIKGLFAYREAPATLLTEVLEEMKRDTRVVKAAPKIVAVSDGETLLAYDMREKESYENPLNKLYCDFAFFYPLSGVERFVQACESPADVKAAEKLAKLHDALRVYNDFSSKDDLHDLNIFIARLLFCFFAEDTGIFEPNLFTGSIVRYTQDDGSDLSEYLDAAFNVMDVRERREDTLKIISQFPYVNGGLFSKRIRIPQMGAKARRIIVECGELDWKNINPDIFGSMIQAVVDPSVRANQGMHYTSVPNILKVINPLFMDELREEYKKLQRMVEEKERLWEVGELTDDQFHNVAKPLYMECRTLLGRMQKMKFFDPACGSGNFLIITYKMLRLLEIDVVRLMRKISPDLDFVDTSYIALSQFYGIELLDFPHEVAMLSLWLAEHQMNKKFHENFGVTANALPLHNITQIVCGNACLLDWETICPHTAEEEVFVFGNPPYLGARLQNEAQKEDMRLATRGDIPCTELDYIATWFYKGANYIKGSAAQVAFVSTNSICQGEQVAYLWPYIFKQGVEIGFAYRSFKWTNNAKGKAAVICVIVGLRRNSPKLKYIYIENGYEQVDNISPYLTAGKSLAVQSRSTPLSDIPPIGFGSMPNDGGALLLTEPEKRDVVSRHPESEILFRQFYGAAEFIKGEVRYCLWITDDLKELAHSIPDVWKRVERCQTTREESKRAATRKLAAFPYKFGEVRHKDLDLIIIPATSSERRDYIPMGYLEAGSVVSNSAFAIYGAELWLFGLLESRMHMIWVRAIGGKLKTDYRYSAEVCYNTFPFPKLSEEKRARLTEAAEEVLLVRADHPGQTLAELYDPDRMPQDLRAAHSRLDDEVDSCYRGYPFADDEARLECLLKLYEKMTAKG